MQQSKQGNLKIIAVAAIGGALEFFDFAIYALLAHFLGHIFFPHQSKLINLMAIFAVFGVGYLARPIGGVILSHIGDKLGRKTAFQISIVVMAFATFFTGCLPTYQMVGVLSPILLILFRLLQSMSIGGEIPGASIFALEFMQEKAGLAVGLLLMGVTLGTSLAAVLIYFLTTTLSTQEMFSFGWRIPFFVGAFLGLVGIWLRRSFNDTPIFEQLRETNLLVHFPLKTLFSEHKERMLIGIGIMCLTAASGFFLYYLPTYTNIYMHYKIKHIFLFNIYTFTLLAVLTAICGYFSDVVARWKLQLSGIVLTTLSGLFLFRILFSENTEDIFVASTLFVVAFSLVNGTCLTMLIELFPARIRYTGVAICYNIGFGIFVGIAPFVVTWLISRFHNPMSPFFYLLVLACISFVATLFYKDCKREV